MTKMLELKNGATKLLADAQAVFDNETATLEDKEAARKMVVDAAKMREELDTLIEIKKAGEELANVEIKSHAAQTAAEPQPEGFKSLGELLIEIYRATYNGYHSNRLVTWRDTGEAANSNKAGKNGWTEQKDLVESIGASGGYLAPTEQRNTLMKWDDFGDNIVRAMATVIPMARRAMSMPVLNQTGTTSGQPHWWGGVLAKWTEEAGEKEETQPSFRQIELVAHKLVCYTEASDELLDDSAVALEALLRESFQGVIGWYEQDAFINGTGAGQPQGVIGAGATIAVAPVAVNALAVADFVNMLEAFQGRNPVWFMNRRWMSDLLQLNGPVGNASYVFIPNAREGAPATLFGYPVHYVEQMPAPGSAGSVLLADWSKYLVGDRQAVTIDSTKVYQFQNDITSWRAVHRVDGQPWLSAPLTWSDGTTQTSPFVILGATAAT